MMKDISNNIDKEENEDSSNNNFYDIKSFFINIIVSIALALAFTSFVNITIVSGKSMYPTLHNKQILIMEKASKMFNNLDRGDIISFKAGKNGDKNIYFIKRIIGIPGDTIEIKDGQVFVNNSLQDEEYIADGILTETVDSSELKVTLKDNEYFVLGDNRENSVDSRFEEIGIVHKNQIISTKLFSIFPGEN